MTTADGQPPRSKKRGSFHLARLKQEIDAMAKPDLYRCRGCAITVTERDRDGHLARCSAATSQDIATAFERRMRPTTEEQARKALGATLAHSRRRPARSQPAAALPVRAQAAPLLEAATASEPAPEAPEEPKQHQQENIIMETSDGIAASEIAQICGVNPSAVHTWIKQGKLTPIGTATGLGGTRKIFARAAVLAFQARRDAGEPPPSKRAPATSTRKAAPSTAITKQATAPISDAAARIRWLCAGFSIGEFTAEDAIARIAALVSAE